MYLDLVLKEREVRVLNTWRYIRKSWISLAKTGNFPNASMQRITSFVEDLKLDLEEDHPEALHFMNADELLTGLELSLRCEDERIETATQIAKRTERANAKDGKGGGFGAMIRMVVKDWREKSKKTNDDQSLSSHGSNSEHSDWRAKFSELEAKTSIWRKDKLETSISFESDFGKRRNAHIQGSSRESTTESRNTSAPTRKPLPNNGSSVKMSQIPKITKRYTQPEISGTATESSSGRGSMIGNRNDTSTVASNRSGPAAINGEHKIQGWIRNG